LELGLHVKCKQVIRVEDKDPVAGGLDGAGVAVLGRGRAAEGEEVEEKEEARWRDGCLRKVRGGSRGRGTGKAVSRAGGLVVLTSDQIG
jgi:hypothetical protein